MQPIFVSYKTQFMSNLQETTGPVGVMTLPGPVVVLPGPVVVQLGSDLLDQ